jgi:hypothetical protein
MGINSALYIVSYKNKECKLHVSKSSKYVCEPCIVWILQSFHKLENKDPEQVTGRIIQIILRAVHFGTPSVT